MTGKGCTGQACAACKYQRRKCSPECLLAPYFPPDQPKQFLSVHKLFGVSNILRILKQLDDSQKNDAMKSIIYQANAREKNPIHGCFGIIVMLQTNVERLKEELEFVRSQLMVMENHEQFQNGGFQQQFQNGGLQPMEGYLSLSQQHNRPVIDNGNSNWTYPYVPHSPYEGHPLYRQTSYDFSRPNDFVEYEQQFYGESNEAHESRYLFSNIVDYL